MDGQHDPYMSAMLRGDTKMDHNYHNLRLDHEVSMCSLIPPAMAISDNMVSMF